MTEKQLPPATIDEKIKHAKWEARLRAQDPVWTAICETTRFVRGTDAGKKIAQRLIQAYLQGERTRA
ncbi:MAG: hypothetical protein IKS41_06730 [Alphaproteobacteria bacterium]|nr:hypothetical protein [Alphaproteobacteria bacterium]